MTMPLAPGSGTRRLNGVRFMPLHTWDRSVEHSLKVTVAMGIGSCGRIIVLIGLAVALEGCSEAESDALANVEAGIQAWADAYNSHEPDVVAARYHPEAVFWGTTSPTLRATPAEIRDYFSSLSNRPMAAVEIGEHRVQLFGDLALAAGFYTFTDVADGERVTRPSRFSFALRLTDGEWLLAQHHSSRIPESGRQ